MAGDLTFRLDPRRLADENLRVSGGVQGGGRRALWAAERGPPTGRAGLSLDGPMSTVLSFVVVVVVVIVAVFFLMFEMRILA